VDRIITVPFYQNRTKTIYLSSVDPKITIFNTERGGSQLIQMGPISKAL
jgi:hypothetical protein